MNAELRIPRYRIRIANYKYLQRMLGELHESNPFERLTQISTDFKKLAP